MRRQKLNLQALAVESFHTTAQPAASLVDTPAEGPEAFRARCTAPLSNCPAYTGDTWYC